MIDTTTTTDEQVSRLGQEQASLGAACEARTAEYTALHGAHPAAASHVVRWRAATHCCGAPLPKLAAVGFQLLCPACVAHLLRPDLYQCRHCNTTDQTAYWFTVRGISPLPQL